MKIEEYFKEGLLKRKKTSKEEIASCLKLAEQFLERAKGNLGLEYFDVSFLLAYGSMFHSARALLFYSGVKERSHFAMIEFLKWKFSKNSEIRDFLDVLDAYRIMRHAIQYSGSLCSKEDAEEAIQDAEKFLEIVGNYLKGKIKN